MFHGLLSIFLNHLAKEDEREGSDLVQSHKKSWNILLKPSLSAHSMSFFHSKGDIRTFFCQLIERNFCQDQLLKNIYDVWHWCTSQLPAFRSSFRFLSMVLYPLAHLTIPVVCVKLFYKIIPIMAPIDFRRILFFLPHWGKKSVL